MLISSEDLLLLPLGELSAREPFFTVSWAASDDSENMLVLFTTISGELLSSCSSILPTMLRAELDFRRLVTVLRLATDSFLHGTATVSGPWMT